jgi:CTP-dependent riboflavin kinase
LEPGTLNLEVDEAMLRSLFDSRTPDLFEEADSVKYPEPFQHIPIFRKGYRYFKVRVEKDGTGVPALLRRAVNPVRGRAELFAEVHLRTFLGVDDGDILTVKVEQTD